LQSDKDKAMESKDKAMESKDKAMESKDKATKPKDYAYFFCLAFGGCSCLFLVMGSATSLVGLLSFGIYQMYITSFLFLLTQLKEYEYNSLQEEVPVEGPSESTVDVEKQEKKKKTVDKKKQYEVFSKLHYPLCMAGISVLIFYMVYSVFRKLSVLLPPDSPSFLIGSMGIGFSLVYMVAANWAGYKLKEQEEYETLGAFLKSSQWLCFTIGISSLITAFGLSWADSAAAYLIIFILAVVLLETIIQSVYILLMQKEEGAKGLKQYVLLSLTRGSNPVTLLLNFLEQKCGITLRSAWSLGFVRHNLIFIATAMAVIFWGMTAFVQVNYNENGVLYRFGKLDNSKLLTPGIHVKMPWPIDTARVYPVHNIKSFPVGFEGGKQENYLWTNRHGGEEYKLLLGDGKELVSVNMIVYYNISNLFDYLHEFAKPEEELKSKAYEVLLKELVATNLDNLLTRDRAGFALTVSDYLQKVSEEKRLGLQVVNVALTSIHPPVEIAQEYQQLVGAKIKKQVIITSAEALAEAALPLAEKERDEEVSQSTVKALERKSEALGEAARYKQQEEGYRFSPEAYRHWKWLEAFEKFMINKKTYIVDESLLNNKGKVWLDLRQGESGLGEYFDDQDSETEGGR
jgi:regulator of protease activity HflC (stomatin/prohibitin superfamily)